MSKGNQWWINPITNEESGCPETWTSTEKLMLNGDSTQGQQGLFPETSHGYIKLVTDPDELTKIYKVRHEGQEVLRALPVGSKERKQFPITTGVLDYFPLALAEVARCSKSGNDQHNPGQPLHWARGKSRDHADCIARHLIQRGTLDFDGVRHSAKVAWRALAFLQEELERESGFIPGEGATND